jgi:heme oxygenase (mycobilin-producing)
MIKRLVKLTFQADKTDEFIAIFEASKDKIRAMSGCLHVELLRDSAASNVFFTLSLWDSEASLNAYRESDFFRITWSKTKALFSDKPAAWTTTVVSACSEGRF